MPKFEAASIEDLFTAERDAGRVARKVEYIVACEASDGSWCEFDGTSFEHAKVLAVNAVENLRACGCSVWNVRTDGTVGVALYSYFGMMILCAEQGRVAAARGLREGIDFISYERWIDRRTTDGEVLAVDGRNARPRY